MCSNSSFFKKRNRRRESTVTSVAAFLDRIQVITVRLFSHGRYIACARISRYASGTTQSSAPAKYCIQQYMHSMYIYTIAVVPSEPRPPFRNPCHVHLARQAFCCSCRFDKTNARCCRRYRYRSQYRPAHIYDIFIPYLESDNLAQAGFLIEGRLLSQIPIFHQSFGQFVICSPFPISFEAQVLMGVFL